MKYLSLVIIATLGTTQCGVPRSVLTSQFKKFKIQYNKRYGPAENRYRQDIFNENLNFIIRHNRLFEAGEKTFTLELNKFADMTLQEIRDSHDCLKQYLPKSIDKVVKYHPRKSIHIANYKNWTREGVVSPVKDQMTCNDCYAFSAIGALESQLLLRHKRAPTLSEQNIVDCSDHRDHEENTNYGCGGGSVKATYNYIIENGGVNSDYYYPYVNKKQNYCLFNDTVVAASMSQYFIVEKTEEALKRAVYLNGPVSVSIQFTGPEIRLYKEGVYSNPKCNNKYMTNHAALVTGYGTTNKGVDYWIVKNSWGEDWGMNGYMLLARNKHNHCGIASDAVLPILL